MNRRDFLATAMAATAAGLLIPEYLLDPIKGRSMVTVASFQQGGFIWTHAPILVYSAGTVEEITPGMLVQTRPMGRLWLAR